MAPPLSPEPLRDYRPEYVPAYIANGLIGLRCGRIPFLDGTAMVNGFAGLDVNDDLEGFARVPFPLGADVVIDHLRLSHLRHRVEFIEQRYDFSRAELTTHLRFPTGGATADLEITQFCSHTQPTVVVQEIALRVDRAADVVLSAGIDPSGVPGTAEYHDHPTGKVSANDPDAVAVWTSYGEIAQCGIAYHVELLGAADPERAVHRADEAGMLSTAFTFRARRDRT